MKMIIASFLLAALPASAQMVSPAKPRAAETPCATCGVVTTVRAKSTQGRTPASQDAPSGLVATVPLGSGGGKPRVGPSQKLGREAVVSDTDWDVVVKLGEGRYQVVTVDTRGDWQVGDKVRIEDGRLVRR